MYEGIGEGATLIAGGPGRPEGLTCGYFVKPTVFANVSNDMTVAREEIFGPVLCMIAYDERRRRDPNCERYDLWALRLCEFEKY